MNTKITVLMALGVLALMLLSWLIVRAWRYRHSHPDETFWPFNVRKGN